MAWYVIHSTEYSLPDNTGFHLIQTKATEFTTGSGNLRIFKTSDYCIQMYTPKGKRLLLSEYPCQKLEIASVKKQGGDGVGQILEWVWALMLLKVIVIIIWFHEADWMYNPEKKFNKCLLNQLIYCSHLFYLLLIFINNLDYYINKLNIQLNK